MERQEIINMLKKEGFVLDDEEKYIIFLNYTCSFSVALELSTVLEKYFPELFRTDIYNNIKEEIGNQKKDYQVKFDFIFKTINGALSREGILS